MKRRKSLGLLKLAELFFVVLFFVSVTVLCLQSIDEKKTTETFDGLLSSVQEDVPDQSEESKEMTAEPTAYDTYASVYEQNNDFVGWIHIDGTNVDYPVMQTIESPNYYLRRAFDKSYSYYGVPYMDEDCRLNESDNMVIYGHNMDNGSMFADLCKYKSEDFYSEHKIIHFDTLDGYGEYEIIAVFQTVAYSQDGFMYHHFVDAENSKEFDEYVSACKELALYDTGVTAEYGDQLLTLSTCEYSRTNGRIVVVAKKIDSADLDKENH